MLTPLEELNVHIRKLEQKLAHSRAQSAAWKRSAKLWRRGAVVFEDARVLPVEREYPFTAADAHHAMTGE